MMMFSFQIVNIMDSLPSIENNIKEGFDHALNKVDEAIPFADINSKSINFFKSESIPEGSLEVVRQSVAISAGFLVSTGLCLLYTFFLLYYRKSFKNFIIYQFEKENRPDIKDTLTEIKETVKSYVGGVGTVMIILSVLNSIGLTIIGIDHPLFWGVLAGILAVIPYVGTALGGMLPFLYALSTTDTVWQPVSIVVYYMIIQQVEGNFITPKIVGDKVDINPFFAILSIVILGSMWGVGGVILALPLISILRIILSQFQGTEPLSILMSSHIMDKGKFKKWADNVSA
jgi:predicted PurR-regulated permease PerM